MKCYMTLIVGHIFHCKIKHALTDDLHYYILFQFEWKACIFIGLQEGDILFSPIITAF
jgi:hypothetical protein